MRKKRIFILIVISLIMILLSGCDLKNTENLELRKGLSEVSFLENQYISIFNKYISDEYIDDNSQIDWQLIEEDYSVVDNSLNVILMDFAGLNIPSKDIVELENNFNNSNVFIEEKNIDMFMRKVCDTYSLVSNSILSNISEDEITKLEKSAKSNLLYIGYNIKIANKDEALKNIAEFENNVSKLNSNKEYVENNSYKINRIFIDIQKLKLILQEDNFEIGDKVILDILSLF